MKYLLVIVIGVACCLGSSSALAQTSSSSQKTDKRTYFKVEIAQDGMVCPALRPDFKEKINQLKGVKDMKVSQEESYMIFSLPDETNVTTEKVKNIAIEVGWPKSDISVSKSANPFSEG